MSSHYWSILMTLLVNFDESACDVLGYFLFVQLQLFFFYHHQNNILFSLQLLQLFFDVLLDIFQRLVFFLLLIQRCFLTRYALHQLFIYYKPNQLSNIYQTIKSIYFYYLNYVNTHHHHKRSGLFNNFNAIIAFIVSINFNDIIKLFKDSHSIIKMVWPILLLLLFLQLAHPKNVSAVSPTWITSNYFRAGNQKVIAVLTGNSSLPQYTFTFSSPLNGTPSLAYGIKNYRGNDYFGQQFYEIRKIGLTSSTFSVEIQIYGITNLHLLTVAYIAVEPNFPHHFNSFDNVPLNYSSGIITNISTPISTTAYFIETINYQTQAAGRSYTNFISPFSDTKIVLFITSLWIRGTSGNPVKVHILPTIINQTHYQWKATAQFKLTITKLQFSQIIFNQKDVESSKQYYIVYQEWITDLNGGFRAIPKEFVDNFIMAVTDFEAVNSGCGFQYQWQFVNDTATGQFGVQILYSWTLTNTCGFSWARSSIFYMKTWLCPPTHQYFNLTTNLCQDLCDTLYMQNITTLECMPIPCQDTCTNCLFNNAYYCLTCNQTLNFISVNSVCVCKTGYLFDNSTNSSGICLQICGDGLLFDQQCDDGNNLNSDGCSSTCTLQMGYNCSGGNMTNKSLCYQICGDGKLINAQCDDGNLVNGDGCSSSCTIQSYFNCVNGTFTTPSKCYQICGDGHVINAQCDDGNTNDGDGCSSICTIEVGYNCSGGNATNKSVCLEICGDGKLIVLQCDDGNLINGDGCSSICTIEPFYNCVNGTFTTPSKCFQICGDGHVINAQCDDGNTNNGDGCSSACQIETGFSCINSNATVTVCHQICGDGILAYDACDDGNLINGDGCSSNCTVESDYVCSGGSLNSSSVCNYNITPTFQLISYVKDPYSNSFSIDVKISELTPNILSNISNFLSFDFPYESLTLSVDPITGLIHLAFTYNQSLNSQSQLTISYKNGKLSSTQLVLPETTDNNLTLKLYDNSFYQSYAILNSVISILSYLAIGSFVLLFVSVSKLIAIEMIFVFQFTYCGLLMLKKLQSLMDPLKLLWIVNSYNQAYTQIQDIKGLPPRVSSIFYKAQFLSNFNLDFIIFFLPILIGSLLYLAYRFSDSTRLFTWSRLAMKEWQISGILFCEFQLAYALVICIQYGKELMTGVIIGLSLFMIYTLFAFIFWRWPHYFGEYKFFFKQSIFCQYFYIIVMFYRLLLSLIMVSFSNSMAAAALVLIASISWSIFLIWKRPYKQNMRPISNSIFVSLIAILLIYTRSQLDNSSINFSTYLPLLIVSLLMATLVLNLYYFAKHHFTNKDEELFQDKIANQSTKREDKEWKKQNKRQEIVQQNNTFSDAVIMPITNGTQLKSSKKLKERKIKKQKNKTHMKTEETMVDMAE